MKRSLTSTFRCERPPRPLSRPPLLTRRGILCPAILLTLVLSTAAVAVDGPCVIPGRGHFYIHVGTGGLFGAFAHDHLIEAQRIEGCAVIDSNDLTHSSIKLTFSTAGIRVLDPKESAKDRAKVQTTMETEVLRLSQYPQVTFESTGLDGSGTADAFRVRGNLTIRGKTQPVILPLTLTHLDDGTYRARGEYKLKQTAFGIQPIQLAGGTVKVKDEVRTEFELFLK
jgi:polyisoprenoid-binding protein YceI